MGAHAMRGTHCLKKRCYYCGKVRRFYPYPNAYMFRRNRWVRMGTQWLCLWDALDMPVKVL